MRPECSREAEGTANAWRMNGVRGPAIGLGLWPSREVSGSSRCAAERSEGTDAGQQVYGTQGICTHRNVQGC